MNLQFNDILNVFFMSHTTVAVLVAFILDITLSRDDDEVRKDIGLQWWEKFRVYSAEFFILSEYLTPKIVVKQA